jgi:uncharacterized membrane protein
MRSSPITFFLLSTIVTSVSSGAVIVSFHNIPGAFSANDMSPDGRYIVGETDLNGDFHADGTYLYDAITETMTILPPEGGNASSVSDDGSVVLGDMPDPMSPDPQIGETAGMWKAETGWQSLGYLPNAGQCPSRSNGYELSGDGSVVVGLSWDGCSGRGFRWTQETGMVAMQTLANGANRASVCSADGNLIGGFAQGTGSRTPAFWNGAGAGHLLDPPSGNAIGEVFGISDDGSVMLGNWTITDPTVRASKWTFDGSGWTRQVLGIGSMFGPQWGGYPMDIADTGTIVGFDFRIGLRAAWLLDGGSPPYLDLKTYIQSNGGTVPVGQDLEVCQAISTNGRFICGHGSGKGWRVTIDLLGDMNCDGAVDLSDVDPFVQALLDPAGYQNNFSLCSIGHADMNQDHIVDGRDIINFVSGLISI